MSYDNPRVRRYQHFFDFGAAADETISIKGPKNKAGRLLDYGVYGVIEVMNGLTVTPKIAIGTTSDPDAYGNELDINALADNDAKSILQTYNPAGSSSDQTNFATYMIEPDLPADTEIYMTLTGATGTPTGQGTAFVDIAWDD